MIEAGLPAATGGTGMLACSGDLLPEVPAACTGVTLVAVSMTTEEKINNGSMEAEVDLDFIGTCGVSKDAQVGY